MGRLLALNALLSRYGNPRSIKAALAHLGLPAGSLRRPFLPLSHEDQVQLGRQLDRIREEHGLDDFL